MTKKDIKKSFNSGLKDWIIGLLLILEKDLEDAIVSPEALCLLWDEDKELEEHELFGGEIFLSRGSYFHCAS